VVHFEAPPRAVLEDQLNAMVDYFNLNDQIKQHGIIRAAIIHLWFITLHPFEDGNGRVARAITDRALAQSEQTSIRFYSLSAAIEAHRKDYYSILEKTQSCKTPHQLNKTGVGPDAQCEVDITDWLIWFLDMLYEAMQEGLHRIQRVMDKTRFWQKHAQTVLSARQIKVLNRLLDNMGAEFTQGIAARQYQGLTGVSKATATRDLADLLDKGCLRLCEAGGRSTRYRINDRGQSTIYL